MNTHISAFLAVFVVLLLGREAAAARYVDDGTQAPVQSVSSANVRLHMAKTTREKELTTEQRRCLKQAADPHQCGVADAGKKPASTKSATPSKDK